MLVLITAGNSNDKIQFLSVWPQLQVSLCLFNVTDFNIQNGIVATHCFVEWCDISWSSLWSQPHTLIQIVLKERTFLGIAKMKQMKNNWGCVCVCARANVSQAICYLLFHEIHLKMRNRSDFIWYSITGWVCGENVSLIWFNLSINWPFCQCTQRCKVITSNEICGQQNFRCAWTNLSPKYLDEY